MANQKPKSCPFNPYKRQSHFVRHLLTTVILVIITFLAGLYMGEAGILTLFTRLGVTGPADDVVEKGTYEQGYQEALDFARQKLTGRSEVRLPSFLIATVKSVNGQNVVIEFEADALDMFAEGMATKTVVVGSGTVVEERVPKSREEFDKEYSEFEKALKAYRADPSLGLPERFSEFIIKTLDVNDLQAGDHIHVRVAEGSTFMNDSVEATEVRLLSRPAPEPVEESDEE